MRLPVTDQFLLSVFSSLQEIDKTFYSFPRTLQDALCPDVFRLRKEYERSRAKRSFSQFISYLVEKGYIKRAAAKNALGILMTKKGAQKALKIRWGSQEKKRRPDGKWLMIIFDIPEKKKPLREVFRGVLLLLGYQKLQQSVWVCPYDMCKETEDAIKEYSLNQYVKSFVIEEVEL